MAFYPEMTKLASFVKRCVDNAGLEGSIKGYFDRYIKPLQGREGSNYISYATFRTIVTAENRPGYDTLRKLAGILSESEGREITAAALGDLISGEKTLPSLQKAIVSEIGVEQEAEVTASYIFEAFKGLPIETRSRVSPFFLRQIADDNEYLDADKPNKALILLRREAWNRGIGLKKFADKIAVPYEVLTKIERLEQPRFTKEQWVSFVASVRDCDGIENNADFWLEILEPKISNR